MRDEDIEDCLYILDEEDEDMNEEIINQYINK